MTAAPAMGTGHDRRIAVRLAEEVMWWTDRDGPDFQGFYPCYTRPEHDPDWPIHVNNDDDRLIVWVAEDQDGERWDPMNDDHAADEVVERMIYRGWDAILRKQIGYPWLVVFLDIRGVVWSGSANERREAVCLAALASTGEPWQDS